METKDLTGLEQAMGVTFTNRDLLTQALVHRSYLNEHRNFALGHNERLEFLGDAVLELVVTEYLYENYKNPEGELTNWRAALVNSTMLATYADQLKLEPYLFLSKGEAKDANPKARAYILANAMEALIGALYLDQGYEVAQTFIKKFVLAALPEILEKQLYRDPKSRLQEASQERLAITPVYKVLHEEGPDHNKRFKIGVYLGTELAAEGEGTSKQEAQVDAAQRALEERGWE